MCADTHWFALMRHLLINKLRLMVSAVTSKSHNDSNSFYAMRCHFTALAVFLRVWDSRNLPIDFFMIAETQSIVIVKNLRKVRDSNSKENHLIKNQRSRCSVQNWPQKKLFYRLLHTMGPHLYQVHKMQKVLCSILQIFFIFDNFDIKLKQKNDSCCVFSGFWSPSKVHQLMIAQI